MTESAAGALARALRVAIAARGAERTALWARLLRSLGHTVVRADEEPEVVLAEERKPAGTRCPTVVLGRTQADAEGLLSADAGPAEIDAALRAVIRGLIVRSAAAARPAFSAAHEAEGGLLLTPREAQVLDAIADGLTNKAIARRLGISLHTVKFHVEAVFRKLGAGTRAEAVARAGQRRREDTIDL